MAEEKEPFKCEICHIRPAKKVWYNCRDEEKYICQMCNRVVTLEWSGSLFHYLYMTIEKHLETVDNDSDSDDVLALQGALIMLNIGRFFLSIPNTSETTKEGNYFWVDHPEVKGFRCGVSEFEKDDNGVELINIRLVKKGWDKPLGFRLRLSLEPFGGVTPVIDEKLAKVCSDKECGFEMPQLWISLSPQDERSEAEIENFINFFGLAIYKHHPWVKREKQGKTLKGL